MRFLHFQLKESRKRSLQEYKYYIQVLLIKIKIQTKNFEISQSRLKRECEIYDERGNDLKFWWRNFMKFFHEDGRRRPEVWRNRGMISFLRHNSQRQFFLVYMPAQKARRQVILEYFSARRKHRQNQDF